MNIINVPFDLVLFLRVAVSLLLAVLIPMLLFGNVHRTTTAMMLLLSFWLV
jgi:hypothetical protein